VNLTGYEAVVERLASLPTTLVHGELYASNVIVGEGRVCPVDWELAGIGPGVLDVAALTTGWPDSERSMLADEYRRALVRPPDADRFAADLDCASLHLALQWLGWSPGWTPPPEHVRDWRAELPKLVERVGL
jgi:thiamine kinase-like enzyme